MDVIFAVSVTEIVFGIGGFIVGKINSEDDKDVLMKLLEEKEKKAG